VAEAVQLEDIRSAGSGALTTPGLSEFKRLIERATCERKAVQSELATARNDEQSAVKRYTNWRDGWLFKQLFKKKFDQLSVVAEEATAKRAELEEQEKLSCLHTQIEMPQALAQEFHRMCDEFALMAKSDKIWDTVSERGTNRVAERTSASRVVDRKPVNFRLSNCEVIDFEWRVPYLANANGGDLFLYPGFVLYFVSSDAFALLEYNQVALVFQPSRFIEEELVPPDSIVVDQTWAKVNKDGSPDRRFKDNYQIPVAQYGKLTLKSSTGLNEEYLLSNAEQTEAFAQAWERLVAAARMDG
jgi:hypothetical protein